MNDATAVLAQQVELCRAAPDPFDRFNSVVLQRGAYWEAQRQVTAALQDPTVRIVCVKSGHMTGKTYLEAGVGLGWLTMEADSGVVLVGPSLEQIRRASWKEVRKAKLGSPLLSGVGRLTRSPMAVEYGEGWSMIGVSGTEPERMQGYHPTGRVLGIVEEASGVNDPDTYQALASLKPVKLLLVSNPLWDLGVFFETCQRGADDPSVRVITIPSTASPDIDVETSPRGLADAAWLRAMVADYGADSQAFRVRVLGQFPEGSNDLLIPGAWLDRCETAERYRFGKPRLAIDLGLGTGGDDTVLLVRDDAGVLEWIGSKYKGMADSAATADRLIRRWGIEPARVSWDAAGIGAGFDAHLRHLGHVGCIPFVGARKSPDPKYDRLRTSSHFALRRRLDPARPGFRPFFIPREFMIRLRREVRELTFGSNSTGANVLRLAEDVAAALRHSPDFSVTLAQSFAFP